MQNVFFRKDCIVPCSQHCGNTVRLFKLYVGPFAEFKCAHCAHWMTYKEQPIMGCYTNCKLCKAQYKVTEPHKPQLCHVCISNDKY